MRRFAGARSLLLLVAVSLAAPAMISAQQSPAIVVMRSENFPLASLQAAAVDARLAATAGPREIEVVNFYPDADLRTQVAGSPLERDPLLLPFAPSGPASLLTQFDGADNQDNATLVGGLVTPPDTNGAVSSRFSSCEPLMLPQTGIPSISGT